MPEQKSETFEIFGVKVKNIDYNSFLEIFENGIKERKKLTIAYANADTLNKIYSDKKLKEIYKTFDIIHPDGIGVYWAIKFLYGDDCLQNRLTGSDFYAFLAEKSKKCNWSYFFFGHDSKILSRIKIIHPDLKITGLQEGYNFDSDKIIDSINKSDADIIIVGLSCPIQERWIFENKERINRGVILAVGDGIKIFADRKYRGPLFMRKLGLEWVIRYLSGPVSNFKKYILGNPLFVKRIISAKVNKK